MGLFGAQFLSRILSRCPLSSKTNHLEIGHGWCIDIIGDSKVSINKQSTTVDELPKIGSRAITKVWSKLKHEGSKTEPEQHRSELRRSLCFSPLVINFCLTNFCISVCRLTLNSGSSLSSLLTLETLARILIIQGLKWKNKTKERG